MVLALALVVTWPFLGDVDHDPQKSAAAQGGYPGGGGSGVTGRPILDVAAFLPVIPGTVGLTCTNYHFSPVCCPEVTALGNGIVSSTSDSKDLALCAVPSASYVGGFIQNTSLSMFHTASDFSLAAGNGGSGCAPCGSGGVSGSGLPELEIVRQHRYRDQTEVSSFGPAVFSNYDVHLYLQHSGDGTSDTMRARPSTVRCTVPAASRHSPMIHLAGA